MGAVIDVMSRKAGKEGRYVHFAMTSADAVETAKAIQASKALDLLIKSIADTRDACLNAAIKWRDLPFDDKDSRAAGDTSIFRAAFRVLRLLPAEKH